MLKYVKRSTFQRSNVKRSNYSLALILAIYLVLAVFYSIVVPIGQGADEWAHYWYAQFIADHGRLPANPTERALAGYKSDWPPLYHLLVAGVTAWIDTAGPPTFKYLPDTLPGADNLRRQLVSTPVSDAILHTDDERFPWQQEILVWHLGRFLSIAFSLGTLIVTYRIALEVFAEAGGWRAGEQGSGGAEENTSRSTLYAPRSISPQTLALVSVAFLAFIPRFLFTGMLFNYDSLTLLLASLFLWLTLRVARGYYPRWGFVALGGLAGLALMTKYLAALLPLEILLLAFSGAAGQQGSRGAVKLSPLPPCPPAPLLALGQAILGFTLITSGWFGYLLINFNEIETYGPVLGTIAPLLRGDGSDRTIEQLFALMSAGQAPSPAHIDRASYTLWQIVGSFFTSFWGNAILQPYPLNWFVWVMTAIAMIATIGLIISWRTLLRSSAPLLPCSPAPLASSPHRLIASSPHRLIASLLFLHCLLPLPFMAVRLFGARDALEAVQGRHLLFLSGPAIVILLVWGLSRFWILDFGFWIYVSRVTSHASRFTLHALLGLLLLGSIGQLIYMKGVYPPLLPVRTTPLEAVAAPSVSVSLPGGATLIGQEVTPVDDGFNFWASTTPTVLKVVLFWQAGPEPASEDYLLELALVDEQGQTRADWLAYQTQAHYPTRAWEVGDTIRDEAWLPIQRLEIGDYQVRLRLVGDAGPVSDWQTLATYTVSVPSPATATGWLLWREGQIVTHPPSLRERETAQFTFTDRRPLTADRQLISPEGISYFPVSIGDDWANFVIGPDWPPGDYRWQPEGEVALRVGPNGRSFQPPALTQPLDVNFENQIKLLGYDLPTRRVQPGEGLPITLYWQGLRWLDQDFVIFERLLDNQGVAWGGYDRRAKENYSTLFWAPGEVVADGFAAPVDAAAPAGVYYLSLGWYRRVEGQAESLVVLDPATGEPTGSSAVMIGPLKVGGPPPGITLKEAAPQTEMQVILGEQIKLLGFDLRNERMSEAANGASPPRLLDSSPLHLTLYWQALTAPPADYTVFVHIRTAAGETVAQKDSPPVGGAYPTSLWDAGEIIKDELSIPLEQVKPGRYELVAGLYDFATGVRLPVAGSPDGEILLQSFEVNGD